LLAITFLAQEMMKLITDFEWQISDVMKRENLISVEMLNIICPL